MVNAGQSWPKVLACAAVWLQTLPVRAAADEASHGGAERSDVDRYRVDFSAGKMVVDEKSGELQLADHVTVSVDRYRLTSDQLSLRRGPHGLEVRGDGCVSFCPCENAPITLGFGAATVAPPTDLLIEDPTIRVGGVPVLWLPYLWLRSPNRLGLLPPRLAWRGEDGLLAGTGVHVPWGPLEKGGARPGSVDATLSGYTHGGVEVVARAKTPQSSSLVRWDHLGTSLAEVDSHGSSTFGSSTGAWSISALRGARARSGTVELRPAAMRYDRARFSVLHVGSSEVMGVGIRGIARRAGPLDDAGLVGPTVSFGASGSLGGFGASDVYAQAWTARGRAEHTVTSLLQGGGVRVDARPGPVAAGVYARERSVATVTPSSKGAAAAAGAGCEASVPLVRRYGNDAAPAWHWLEPFVRADGALGDETGEAALPLASGDRWVSALAGVRNAIQWGSARSAADLTLSAGWLGLDDRASPALSARMSASGAAVATDVSLAWLPDDRSAVSVSRVRVGFPEGVVFDARVEGRQQARAAVARWLDRDVWNAPWNGWYSLPGWSAGTGLLLPWTSWLASSVAADYDLTADRALAERAGLAYRHPCGCLAVVADAGHRLGRRGFDASVTLDLLP